jgi:glycosyltransferase involved in cell wall biosynthesis
VLAQNYQHFEIIISDNLSDDGTLEYIKKKFIKNKKIKIFKQNKHIHPMQNFSFVYEKSSGQIFKWLAYDDYLKEKDIFSLVNRKFNNGFNFIFTNNEVRDLTQNTYVTNYMKIYEKTWTKEDFLIKSIFNTGFLFYGFYSKTRIREYIKILNNNSNITGYEEGAIIHYNLLKSKTCYLSNKNIVFRITKQSVSKNLNPINELKGYKNYYFLTLKKILKFRNLNTGTKAKFTILFSINFVKYYISILKRLLKYVYLCLILLLLPKNN